MKIVITGSLGNISKPLVKKLVENGADVTVISRSLRRTSQIEEIGAKAAIGDHANVDFLADTFSGSDAIYLMIPPNLAADDLDDYIAQTGRRYAEAISRSGVKRVVALSSMGAHLPSGNGPLSALGEAEKYYSELNDVNFTYLRPGGFYTNYLAQIGLVKQAGILGDNTAPESRFLLTHPSDIADAAAEALLHPDAGRPVRYIVSTETTNAQIAAALGKSIGKDGLQWAQFADDDFRDALLKAGFSPSAAEAFVQMGKAFRDGRAFEQADRHPQDIIKGKRSFADFAVKEFAPAFNAQ